MARINKLVVLFLIVLVLFTRTAYANSQAYTVDTYGFSWPEQKVGINIQRNPQWAYSLVVEGMMEWNAALNWFMQTYYPQTPSPYQLTESASGPVNVRFYAYNESYPYAALTSPSVNADGSFRKMDVKIILPDTSRNSTDYVLQVVNHELGHVLGLMEAPATESGDVMCFCGISTSKISTLDLYAVLMGSRDFKGTVTLPQHIPFDYYDPTPVPEFPYASVIVTMIFACLVLEKCRFSSTRRPSIRRTQIRSRVTTILLARRKP